MLSVTVRRALRALVVLAALPEGETISGKELAARAEGPANYLSKILHILGSAGVIDAHREAAGDTGCAALRRRFGWPKW